MCKSPEEGDGDSTLHFRDLDGSLSGTAGATVIFNETAIIGDNCVPTKDSEDFATCPPEQKFAAVCT
jgi:hypothetical protein